jgi:hypothetical protein
MAVCQIANPESLIEIDLGCPGQPRSSDDQVVLAGIAAWSRLKQCKTWRDWLVVGEALLVGRTEAMRSAHTNVPEGSRYNREFGDWLVRTPLGEIDKSTRKRLLDCMARGAGIEAWRATLPLSLRLDLNHPHAVLRRWQATQKPRNAVKKPSYVAKLNAALIQSQEETARLKRDVERNGAGDRWTPESSADQVAEVIVGTFKAWKAREIAQAINRRLKKAEKD